MRLFTGAGVAMVTPFKDDRVDIDAFADMIEYQIQNGTDALIINGTTGEPPTMTDDEKALTLSTAIEVAKKRIPVIAGTGGNNTKAVVANSKKAAAAGADACLIVTPYYNKCTQKGLVAHYKYIADEVSLPIIVYNVPPRTGLNISPAALNEIAGYKSIVGIKEASGNIVQMTEMTRLCLDRMDFYSGEDALVVPLLALGGAGVISVASNIVPRMMHDLVASFLAGDVKTSRELQFRVNPLVDLLFCETNPIPVKEALGLLGRCAPDVRMPLTRMEPQNSEKLRAELHNLGLL